MVTDYWERYGLTVETTGASGMKSVRTMLAICVISVVAEASHGSKHVQVKADKHSTSFVSHPDIAEKGIVAANNTSWANDVNP